MNTETKQSGRRPVNIDWPDGEFSIEQLHDLTKLSKVTIYQKVKSALSSQTIFKSSKEQAKTGRPKTLFKRTRPATSPTFDPSAVTVASV